MLYNVLRVTYVDVHGVTECQFSVIGEIRAMNAEIALARAKVRFSGLIAVEPKQ